MRHNAVGALIVSILLFISRCGGLWRETWYGCSIDLQAEAIRFGHTDWRKLLQQQSRERQEREKLGLPDPLVFRQDSLDTPNADDASSAIAEEIANA